MAARNPTELLVFGNPSKSKQGKCGARFRKPASRLRSDRAKRHRANTPECRPTGPKQCAFCGSRKNVETGHVDGHESNNDPKNLIHTCRSCNVKAGLVLKRARLGRRVSQTNPPREGAKTVAQWVTAVLSMKGESDAMAPADAIAVIHATPASRRSQFAREIHKRRRQRGNPQELLIFNPSRGEKKHNPKKSSTAKRRAISKIARRCRRNPSEAKQAVKLFESFHGKQPKEIAELQVSAAIRQDYTSLGDCLALGLEDGGMTPKQLALRWRDANHIGFEGDKVKLASAPNGKQLYLIGGNQNLSGMLSKWEGVDRAKDFIDLGECFFVTYLARKIHSNFEPTEWTHAFGEKGGTLPRLAFDQLRNQIFFIGGEYFIDLKDISPGIEN